MVLRLKVSRPDKPRIGALVNKCNVLLMLQTGSSQSKCMTLPVLQMVSGYRAAIAMCVRP